jgi:hypothetical protein
MSNDFNNLPAKLVVNKALWIVLLLSSSVAINPLRVLAETKKITYDIRASQDTPRTENLEKNIAINTVQNDPLHQKGTEFILSKLNNHSELPVASSTPTLDRTLRI